jgi:tetratricopeptide (TPR) repeat protein
MDSVFDGSRWAGIAVLMAVLPVAACGDDVAKPAELGEKALLRGDVNEAIARFNEAISIDPNNAAAYRGRGYIYFVKNKPAMAIADLTKAIQLDPAGPKAYRNRGDVYFAAIGDRERAIADYGEAIRRGLKDSDVLNNRGSAYLAKGDVESAIADFDEAIRLDKKSSRLYENRARARRRQGRNDLALKDLDEAIRNDPNMASALRLRAEIYADRRQLDAALLDLDKAIHFDPQSASGFRQRADIRCRMQDIHTAVRDYTSAVRLALGEPDTNAGPKGPPTESRPRHDALADCNNAIRLQPNSPFLYEARGTLQIELGDYDRGIADIQTAIRLNPHDPAATFEPSPKTPLTPVAIEHGKEQLRRMLRDRPAMAKYGSRAQVLYEWATRKFAGEDVRQKISWDASEPSLTTSEIGWSTTTGAWCVRFARKYDDGTKEGAERCFEDLWYDAVFELYNTLNADDISRIFRQAFEGRLQKQEFVTMIVQCESRTAERTRAFYIHVFLPWAKSNRVASRPQLWHLACRFDASENLLAGRVAKTSPYWRAYERDYDLLTLRALVRKGENEKALDLAGEMRKRAETPQEIAAICKHAGWCLLRLKRPLPAINAFTELIRVVSNDPDAYLGRAAAHMMLRETDRAIADCSEAIRLQPSDPDAYQMRGAAYDAAGDKDRARADAAMAKTLNLQKTRHDKGSTIKHDKEAR